MADPRRAVPDEAISMDRKGSPVDAPIIDIKELLGYPNFEIRVP
jgi:hypothetical protein